MGGGDALHPFQRLDSTLRLPGFGGLGPEAGDEAFQMGNFPLLLVIRRLLQGQSGGALCLEIGITAGVESDTLLINMGNMVNHAVEDIAVVGDEQQGAGISAQPLFQPQHRVEIKMVGRFIQQQQIGAAHQRFGQIQPHPPAAGEFGHRPLQLLRGESESRHELTSAGAGAVAANRVKAGVKFRLTHAIVSRFSNVQIVFDLA